MNMRQTLLNLATSAHWDLNNSDDSSVVKPEPNLKMPNLETVELVNNYKYFQRFEILWDDLAEWL